MNFTPLLVVLLGVVTVCGCNRPAPYGQRMFVHQREYFLAGRDDHFNPRDRSYDYGHHQERSQVGRLPAQGVVAIAFLPRHENGSINFDIIPQYAEFLSQNGIKVVQILGVLGGGPNLGLAERRKVIDVWVRVGKKLGLSIRVQVGGAPYPVVIATAKYAQEAGADSIATLSETYYRPATVEQLVDFIDDVGRAAPRLPVLYVHFPNMTGVDFPPSEIMRIAKARVPNFRGIQYESNNLRPLPATLNEIDDDNRLVYAGDSLGSSAYILRVTSFASRVVNIWPQPVAEILGALRSSDIKRARELQGKYNMGIEAIENTGNAIAALKVTMEIVNGLKMGPPGRPVPSISHSARNKLEYRLRELGLVNNH